MIWAVPPRLNTSFADDLLHACCGHTVVSAGLPSAQSITLGERFPTGEALLMATACEDGTVCVHDVESGAGLYDHTDDAAGVNFWAGSQRAAPKRVTAQFASTGAYLAVAYGDHRVQLLDSETGEHVLTLVSGGEAQVTAMAWSTDASMLGTAYGDGTCRLWNVPEASPG